MVRTQLHGKIKISKNKSRLYGKSRNKITKGRRAKNKCLKNICISDGNVNKKQENSLPHRNRKKKERFIEVIIEEAEKEMQKNEKELERTMKNLENDCFLNTYGIKEKKWKIVSSLQKGLDSWKIHFQNLSKTEYWDRMTAEHLYDGNVKESVEPPTLKEVRNAIKCMKNDKETEEEKISNEILKKGGKVVLRQILDVMLKIWDKEKIPKEWCEVAFESVRIRSDGDHIDCSSRARISVLNAMFTLISKVIEKRIENYIKNKTDSERTGFFKSRSTTEQIFLIKEVIAKCLEFDKNMFLILVHFKKSDETYTTDLWRKLKNYGVPEKLIRLTKMVLSCTTDMVKMNGESTSSFQIKTGVDRFSSLLFNIFLHELIHEVGSTYPDFKFGDKINVLAFADSVFILAESMEDLELLLKICFAKTHCVGLAVNDEKSTFMKVGRRVEPNGDRKVVIEDHYFEEKDEFEYHGVLISSKSKEDVEIDARIKAAYRALTSVETLMNSELVSIQSKLEIFKNIVRPVLLYESETWIMNKRTQNKLITFENKILRKIFSSTSGKQEWRIKKNTDLRLLYREPDVVAVAKDKRLNWAQRVYGSSREKGPSLKKLCERKPKEKRPSGRPKMRWRDQVAKDFMILEEVG